MAINQDPVDVECPECGHCFEYSPDENVPPLTVTEAAEALFCNYCPTPPTAGEVDGLAEDITRLLTEKYNIPIGVI